MDTGHSGGLSVSSHRTLQACSHVARCFKESSQHLCTDATISLGPTFSGLERWSDLAFSVTAYTPVSDYAYPHTAKFGTDQFALTSRALHLPSQNSLLKHLECIYARRSQTLQEQPQAVRYIVLLDFIPIMLASIDRSNCCAHAAFKSSARTGTGQTRNILPTQMNWASVMMAFSSQYSVCQTPVTQW